MGSSTLLSRGLSPSAAAVTAAAADAAAAAAADDDDDDDDDGDGDGDGDGVLLWRYRRQPRGGALRGACAAVGRGGWDDRPPLVAAASDGPGEARTSEGMGGHGAPDCYTSAFDYSGRRQPGRTLAEHGGGQTEAARWQGKSPRSSWRDVGRWEMLDAGKREEWQSRQVYQELGRNACADEITDARV